MDSELRKKIKEENKEEREYKHALGDICPLSHLKIGQVGKVIEFKLDNKVLRRRLLDMGITRNVDIGVVKISPLGDPYNIELRGYELCMRKDDLQTIIVKVVN